MEAFMLINSSKNIYEEDHIEDITERLIKFSHEFFKNFANALSAVGSKIKNIVSKKQSM